MGLDICHTHEAGLPLGAMAEEVKSSLGEDALPMQKAGSGMLIAGGLGVVVIGGLIAFALSGGEPAPAEVKATEKAASESQGMTKVELEERQAHLKKTQAALIAAAEADAKAGKKASPTPQAAPVDEDVEPAPRNSATAKSSTTAKSTTTTQTPAKTAAKKPANSKKSLDGLDALGADITSALK